ncbi:MAG: glutamate racemase [Lachnospirales bacterium]
MSDNRPIGVFDSGVGGLTVAYELFKILKGEELIYFADSLRAPYGSLDSEVLLKYSCEVVDFFIGCDVKSVVLACNTLCAAVLDDLKIIYKEYDIIFQGVIDAGVLEIIEEKSENVGLLATKNTVDLGTYATKLKEYDNTIKLVSKPAAIFVSIVEKDIIDKPLAYEAVKYHLRDLINAKVDTIVLGCTHFPIMQDLITHVLTEDYKVNVKLINPARKSASNLYEILKKKNMLGSCSGSNYSSKISFYTSGSVCQFKGILDRIFDEEYEVNRIEIGEY